MRTLIFRITAFVLIVLGTGLSSGCFGDGDSTTTNNNILPNPSPVTNNQPPIFPVETPPLSNSGVVYSIETLSADYLSDTAVTLYGRINATWISALESAYFRYRFLGGVYWGNPISVGRVNGVASSAIAGLVPGTQYEFQFFALVGSGERAGTIRRFTTNIAPPVISGNPVQPPAPTPNTNPPTPITSPVTVVVPVVTLSATNIERNSAVLHGFVNGINYGNGAAYFLISLDNRLSWTSKLIGRPQGIVPDTTITNLTPNTVHWVKLIAVTGTGSPYQGEWVSFRTLSDIGW